MPSHTLVIVLGPTAIGKTSTSIKIAQALKTEIISSDSRQIFKEMHVGTAVPNSQELHTVKHSMIQNHSIHENYSASLFEEEALLLLENKFKNHKSIVMTGGSMLYIDTLCNGIDELPPIPKHIRDHYVNKYNLSGIESLRFELKKVDPEYYSQVDLKNHKRIIRALEVHRSSGHKYSSLLTRPKKERFFNTLKIGLNMDRKLLHDRINLRVDLMVKEGLIEEARSLYEFRHLNALNTVGYKELFSYFDGDISLDTAIELIKRNTRRYARRQLTWFNKDKEVNWFEPSEEDKILNFISQHNL